MRWEYNIVAHNVDGRVGLRDLIDQADKIGRDGWELVGVSGTKGAGDGHQQILYFKRPLQVALPVIGGGA